MTFKIFIGIDQTGAVNSRGIPRQLDASIIDCSFSRPRYFTGLKLPQMTHAEISLLLTTTLPKFASQNVLICVDSVFGLPKALDVSPAQIFEQIRNYTHLGKHYGAITAHAFFTEFLRDGVIEHREVERKVKANSVFRLKPFQRNIGCGSYRVLKELSQDTTWFDLWPHQALQSQYAIAEGYPSYFWKHLLGAKSRDLTYLKKKFKHLNFKTTDEADSFVLAYGAMNSLHQLDSKRIHPSAQKEGWILGVPYED